MPDVSECPKCESDNVFFSKKRARYVCEDCDHEFTPDEPFAPQKVFISYGHDEHVSLAIRLRDDLRERGHEVWFDEERLDPGHDWETFIEQGLKALAEDRANGAILVLMTPYAVRRPGGFCLNEIARALGHGLRIIPLMVVESEPPLSICRIQWLDMRPCLPISEKEELYKPRYERLLQALEDRQLDFEGAQSRLLATLQPIQFSADIVKLLRDFTGRKWVFEEVDAWLADPEGKEVFWISGEPGVGKSAIAAYLRENRRQIGAFHFCDIHSEEKRDPAKLVRSVAYQLSTQLPEYEARLSRLSLEEVVQEYHEAYTLFDKLVVQPLAEQFPEPDRTIVVLIDALDEATANRNNDIVLFLTRCAGKTPSWLRFLVTSRPDPEITGPFHALDPCVLDTDRDENRGDLQDFLQAQLPGITPSQVQAVLSRSEGVFLYVRHVVDAIHSGQLNLARPDEFPRGLADVYLQYFDRQFGDDFDYYEERITPLLLPVLAAFEPLELGLLQQLCGSDTRTEFGRRLNRLGSLFPTTGTDADDTIRPFHRSLSDWLTDREASGHYYLAMTDGHRLLAEHGWQQYEQAPEDMNDYLLAWLPGHVSRLGQRKRFSALMRDLRYLGEKCRRGMFRRLHEDYFDFFEIRPSGDCKERIMQDLAVARHVQRLLLPSDRHQWGDYQLCAASLSGPLSRGNWYDVIDLGDERLMVVVGEPHGGVFPAYTRMIDCRDRALSLIADFNGLGDFLKELDRLLPRGPGYVTLGVLLLDRRDNICEYASAGHPPMLVKLPNGAVRSVRPDGPALGLLPDELVLSWQASSLSLEAGTSIMLFSDGVVEASDEELGEFGVKRLMDLFENSSLPPSDMSQLVRDSVLNFVQDDDGLWDDPTWAVLARLSG